MGSYLKCGTCGLLRLSPLPEVEENAHFEGDQAVDHQWESDTNRRQYFRQHFRTLKRVTDGPGKLLDVGCSTGMLLSIARKNKWEVEGLELSSALAEAARRRVPDATIHEGELIGHASLDRGNYTAISAIDVIEHVLDPESFLLEIHQLLMPGGIVILQTPNASSLRARLHGKNWNMLIPEYHFHLFTPTSLNIAFRRAGFNRCLIRTKSGTGNEKGWRKRWNKRKESLLRRGSLGNALLGVARR